MSWSSLTGQTKAAVIFAILGFVVSFSTTNTSSINGVYSCSYMNFGALIFGVLALIAGGIGLAGARDLSDTKGLNMGLCAVALLIGALHIGRGLGMVGGPCG